MEHIRYEVDGPIGVITLDRTEKANAVDQQALDELNATAWLDEIEVRLAAST